MLKSKKSITTLSLIILGINVLFSVACAEIIEKKTGKTEPITKQAFEAKDVVVIFQNELIEVMKAGKELGFEGRYRKLETAIASSHDLAKISRIIVGKEWKKFSDDQKTKLAYVFNRLSVSAYAHNFKEFSGESFKYLSENETPRGGKIIHTVLVLPNDKDVKFDYMLKKKGDSWKIINIIANGVSDLALKRSEYTSILKRHGFDVLIEKISEKIDNYAKQ